MEKTFEYTTKLSLNRIIVKRMINGKSIKNADSFLKKYFKNEYIKGTLKEIDNLTIQGFESRFCPNLRSELMSVINKIDINKIDINSSISDVDKNVIEIYSLIKKHLNKWLKIETKESIQTIYYPNEIQSWIEHFFVKSSVIKFSMMEHFANVFNLSSEEEVKKHLLEHILVITKNRLEEKINLSVEKF